MAQICREVDQWITEQVQQPLENWVTQEERRCREQECNWWCLCCNKWFCWIVTVLVRVITWILVTITRLVTTLVCEIVTLVLDLAALLVNLVLSIPVLGGILRTIINWVGEIIWRIAGLPDFILTLAGVQLPKKMHVKVIILNRDGRPLTDEATVLPAITAAQTIFRRECNVNLIYTGTCSPKLATPSEALVISCDAGGFFADWWIAGAYFELVSADCAFDGGHRRVVGYGAELIAFIIQNVTPDSPTNTIGCSMGPTHNYIVEEVGTLGAIAHELGHACGLWHVDDVNNLMNPSLLPTAVTLDRFQRAMVRNSRHCTFL